MVTAERGRLVERGVIEGFYGRPFTHVERLALIRFAGARGFNVYVYAPKNDPLHRERWREPYPETDLASFAALAREGAAHGVRLFYAIAPGLTYDAREPRDFELLADKIRNVVRAGARGIALLFDDLTADSTTLDPVEQAQLVARTAELVTSIDATLAFWFIGNFYCGDVAELRAATGFWSELYQRRPEDYFAAYDAYVPRSVPIMWTGPAVFSATIGARDTADFAALARRPVVLWDNFPVNDTLPGQLFLGPYVGREPGALASLHGVVLNLMSQASANRIAIATAAECFDDVAGYDPEAALERALASLASDDRTNAALRTFVAQHRGHPVLAAEDAAPALGRCIAAALSDPSTPGATDALRAHLLELAGNEADLRATVRDASLLAEIAPWSAQLTRLARAALAGLDALDGRGEVATYEELREQTRPHDHVVAASVLPPALQPFVAGQGPSVDRFAELFAAIDARLARADVTTRDSSS